MTARLTLPGDHSAEFMSVDGDRVVLQATTSSPPGSTLVGRGVGIGECRVKVASCRMERDHFRIEGRFIDLSRSQRRRLEDAIGRRVSEP